MWQSYASLAEQKLQDMYDDAAARRSLPPRPARQPVLRAAVGRAMVRWGERLARPVESSAAH